MIRKLTLLKGPGDSYMSAVCYSADWNKLLLLLLLLPGAAGGSCGAWRAGDARTPWPPWPG